MTGNPCTMGHAQSAQVVKKAAVAKLCKPKDLIRLIAMQSIDFGSLHPMFPPTGLT
jgi:hypothetical protein